MWLKGAFGATSAEIGSVLGTTGLVFALSNVLVVGRLAALAPEPTMLCVAIGTIAAGRFLQAACATTRALFAANVPVAVGGALSGTLVASLHAREAPPQHLGYVLGLSESADGLAGIVAPAVAGRLLEMVAPTAPAITAGCVSVGALVLAAGVLGVSGVAREERLAGKKEV